MKQIFPFIDNNIGKQSHRNQKIKRMKLEKYSRLNTFSNISSFKSLKTEILQNFNRYKSTNKHFHKNNDFMISIENFAKRVKDKSIKEYTKISDDLMERYTYYNPKAETEEDIINYEDEMTKTKADYFLKKKKDIQFYLNKSKKLMRTMNDFNNQKAIIKFTSPEFKNPIDSLGLILKNKTIHDKVLDNYQNREMKTFGNNISRINKIKKVLNLTKNVKVSPLIPISFEKLMENSLDRDNIEKNRTSIISHDLKKPDKTNTTNLPEENNNNNNNNTINNPQTLKSNKLLLAGSLTPDVFKKGSIYLLPGFYQPNKKCPESREEFSLNKDPVSNSLFLFSGNSSQFDSPLLWKFNLSNFIWESVKPPSNVIVKRCGHTGVIYKSKLIIFGGRLLENTALGDIEIYNIEHNYWEMNNYNTIIFLKLRRNHVACLVGQQMFVHGGIDEEGEYLDDSFLLSLGNNYQWTKAKIINMRKRASFPKLAFHSCCLVVPYEMQIHPRFSIYKLPEVPIGTNNSRIREKGIYIFGGKKSELKDPCNKMWVLKIGKKYLEWMEIISKGKPPCPRYLFSMNFYEKGNYIIIHGGKTKSLKNEQILKDTYLFELLRFEWIRVIHGCFDSIVKPRFSHSAVIYNKRLIIFGGVNEQGFSGSNFFMIKLQTEANQDIFFKEIKKENRRNMLQMRTVREIKDSNEKNNESKKEDDKEENKNDNSNNKSFNKSKKKKLILKSENNK